MAKQKSTLAERLMNEISEADDFFGPEGPCPALVEPGAPGSKVILVSGENAGGKSFIVKWMKALVHNQEKAGGPKIEFMDCGMHLRTMPGIHRAFMYGEENVESTGNISIKAVLGGLATCRKREHAHVLSLDEPDIGLSEGYQTALGELIEEFAVDMPEKTEALVVVTHSRQIAWQLLHGTPGANLSPHCIRVGDDLRPTREWVANGPLKRSVDDLKSLAERTVHRYRAMQKVIDERIAEKKSRPGPKR
jgi:hypothetical protein